MVNQGEEGNHASSLGSLMESWMADFSVYPLLHASLCSLSSFLSPLYRPYHTRRGSDRPLLPASPLGVGVVGFFTLVSNERRGGPDLKTTLQAFLIRSLMQDTCGLSPPRLLLSLFIIWLLWLCCGVYGFCMEEMNEQMNGKG